MKLIKLSSDHYIIVDDSEINIDDIVLETYVDGSKGLEHIQTLNDIHPLLHKKVTHSSIPIEGISLIDKYEVKELLGEVDVEKKVSEHFKNYWTKEDGTEMSCDEITADMMTNMLMETSAYNAGYNQALEDNKDRKYTEEDMIRAYRQGGNNGAAFEAIVQHDYKDAVRFEKANDKKFMASLQPLTSWDVEFVDGKLKLL